MKGPEPLEPSFREKLWGVRDTAPWFAPSGMNVGEVWFLGPGGEPLPLLVKFVFTSQKLSVQVHPGDEYARRHEGSLGKTEMWHVLRADPGAAIALGLTRTLSRERLRRAALSGEIEELLNWVPVAPGDTIFMPAGTIHAIGPGLALVEIQQQSDITYRLYDYGRPRELHLDKALDVSCPGPHPGKKVTVELAPGLERLVACPWFVADRITVQGRYDYPAVGGREHLLIAVEGSGAVAGEPFLPGQAWRIGPGAGVFPIEGEAVLLRTYAP